MVESASFIDKIFTEISDGVHFVTPTTFLRTNEVDLIRGVLHILQGLSSYMFYWDSVGQSFHAKSGIYIAHLSQTSLHTILNKFIYSATCLKLVEILVNKVETSVSLTSPTMRAFACSVSVWLKRLRDIALNEEVNIRTARVGTTPTILGLASSLSSLFSGAEYLLQIVDEAIPKGYLELHSSPAAAEVSVHILDYLYKKLNEICPVQGGEEDAYRMLLYIFVGSSLPYVEGLDSWLFEGILDDPFDEMFFYANEAISINDADFWEKSYLLRQQFQKLDVTNVTNLLSQPNEKKETTGRESISTKGSEQNKKLSQVCPLFIKDIATAIVSAGKSLQLIRHCHTLVSTASVRGDMQEIGGSGRSVGFNDSGKVRNGQSMLGLTLSEVFCVSLACLIGHGDHLSKHLWQDEPLNTASRLLSKFRPRKEKSEKKYAENLPLAACSENVWYKFLVNDFCSKREIDSESSCSDAEDIIEVKGDNIDSADRDFPVLSAFCPQNPAITVCRSSLLEKKGIQNALNLSKNFYLPPLNDESLRNDIFGTKHGPFHAEGGTNYTFGFQFGDSEYFRSQNDIEMLEGLFPFPTLLPSFQEELYMSEFLPFQKNSTLPSRVLRWILNVDPKTTPLPVVILQECLSVYIEKQVDYIGRNVLSKLLNDWRLMDELGVLRAIFLLGSGDLLQHFLTVLFDKMDKGESCDDDFELNMILQESISNSSDGRLLSTPDSLVVSITQDHGAGGDGKNHAALLASTPRKSHGLNFGISGLDSLNFSYKVSWPLELIANKEAIRKYNQVMSFLLKVKRAKFVLDKARRWMWKGRGSATISRKHHWLVEQKLLHFVDAFHQYVMDRVYHSAWGELCEGMAAAASLDEVINVHEAYLTSIQRQCFVVPDKLWALIASRINIILGLALDFHNVQQTLTSGAVSAIRARCEMEVDRIEKQFDDCIAFLLRVLSFKLNVGHFPHLADLVTRINYNYFYMSDSGNLIAAPGSEAVSSKTRKGFPV